MSYYVRMIKLDRWDLESPSENNISGEAVTIDWKCQNNEWSVYKCESPFEKNEEKNKIVLRMAGANPRSTADGIDLLYLEDSFIKKIGLEICPDDQEVLSSLHCNLRYVNYDKIKTVITYTMSNLNRFIISYSSREIRELFLKADKKYIEEYENVYDKSRLKDILKNFFKDLPAKALFKKV